MSKVHSTQIHLTPQGSLNLKMMYERISRICKNFNSGNINSVLYGFCGWKSYVCIKLTYYNFVEIAFFPRVLELILLRTTLKIDQKL